MSDEPLDLAIVGGGLAGGLIALAVRARRPDLSLALIEAGASFGGNHRWSWFERDLPAAGSALLDPFAKAQWDDNEVRFPRYSRTLGAKYRSLGSRDFDAGLRRILPQSAIRTGSRATRLAAGGVTLENGTHLAARRVIDCRDPGPSPHLTGGWQVFLGQHWRTFRPHGLPRPVIMDASVAQPGAYRFVYLLPLAPDEIFIEDTYYADSPAIDEPALRARIAAYAAARGWSGEVLDEETGALPVITGGDFAAFRRGLEQPGVALAGARGGFVHPLTSYTMPIAVANALAIADLAHLPGPALANAVAARATRHWADTSYYRLLGKMLFEAALPSRRFEIFERFYRLPEPLIERFYAARSTPLDKARILTGKPPVPVGRAVRALLGKGAPLVHGDRR